MTGSTRSALRQCVPSSGRCKRAPCRALTGGPGWSVVLVFSFSLGTPCRVSSFAQSGEKLNLNACTNVWSCHGQHRRASHCQSHKASYIMVTISISAQSTVAVNVKLSFAKPGAPDPWPPLDGDTLLELLGHMSQGTLQAVGAVSKELKRLAYDPSVPNQPWSCIDMGAWPFFLKEKKQRDAVAAAKAMEDGLEKWFAQMGVTDGTSWGDGADVGAADHGVLAAVRLAGALLKTLRCSPIHLTDNGLARIGLAAPNLTALDLSEMPFSSSNAIHLTDEGIASIGATLPCLSRLSLSFRMDQITDEGVRLLLQGQGAHLEQLTIPLPRATELTLRFIGQFCSKLTYLNIDNLGRLAERHNGVLNDSSRLGPAAEPELLSIFEANGKTLEHLNLGFGCVVDVLNSTLIKMMACMPRHQLKSFRGVRLSLGPLEFGLLELLLPQDSPVPAYAHDNDINNNLILSDLTSPIWELFTWYFHSATSLRIDDIGAENMGVYNDFDLRRN